MKIIIHEVLLPINLVPHARPPLNDDDHLRDLIVIHYVLLLPLLLLKLIIQHSLPNYFLLLLVRTFLLLQMFN